MQTLTEILQQDWINSLGWMLLHSLWQHALVALVCALLLSLSQSLSANARYLIACSSFCLGILISAITFYQHQLSHSEIVLHSASQDGLTLFFIKGDSFNAIRFIDNYIDNLIAIWLCGFLVLFVKIVINHRHCQHIKNHYITPTPEKWQRVFELLSEKLGIKRKAELRISTLITIPCVIGHVKPVVLLPMGLLLNMNQQQVEAILLHELAHVRRNDYCIGLIQSLTKALFFFNPFLYWISHQIDKEREYACDDIAVAINQNPVLFANTLKEFAEMSIKNKSAMGITGKNMLLTRVVRLFNKKQGTPAKQSLIASLLLILSGVVITVCVNAAPEISGDKKISLDVSNVAVKEVLQEVNKKCGTSETITTNANEQLTLLLEDISCTDAIKLLKDFAEGDSTKDTIKE